MRQNEFGETLFVQTNIDITGATNLNLFISRPHLDIVRTTVDGVTIGTTNQAVNGIDYVIGFYVTYVIQNGDITQAGQYEVRLEFDLGSIHHVSSTACFTVTKQEDLCPCPPVVVP